MDPRADLLELSILYDTARGFLGLRQPEDILDTTLLSMMGACGARSAVALEPEGVDGVLPSLTHGDMETWTAPLKVTARARETFDGARTPFHTDDEDALGARFARAAQRQGLSLLVPMRVGPELIALGPKLLGEPYADRDLAVVREIAGQAAIALTGAQRPLSRRRSSSPGKLARALREQYPVLRSIRGENELTSALLAEIVALSDFDLPVLVLGETGTGKELVAHAIHALSRRCAGQFEAINCAAIPRDLMASALFGHEKGAFTGADSTVPGAFERSGDGTIFLDEIGDMPLDTQAMLLRVLEERRFRRVGGTEMIPAEARVISATNRNLLEEVEEGRFRRDLFYRLQMYTVRIRPLRERADEIPTIAEHVLKSYRETGGHDVAASREFYEALSGRALPGNVRELESLIAGAIVQSGGERVLRPEHLPDSGILGTDIVTGGAQGIVRGLEAPRRSNEPEIPSWENMEREYILSVLRLTEGNRKEAARLMGIPRTTLNSKMTRFGLGRRRGVRTSR